MDPLESKLTALIEKTDLSVSEQQIVQLVGYVKLLDKWNHAYNLTSVRDPDDMLVRHILDSIVVSPYLQGKRVIEERRGFGEKEEKRKGVGIDENGRIDGREEKRKRKEVQTITRGGTQRAHTSAKVAQFPHNIIIS